MNTKSANIYNKIVVAVVTKISYDQHYNQAHCRIYHVISWLQRCSIPTLLVGYTFPGRNPVLWYRGKVNADSQGRCHSIKSFQHSRHSIIPKSYHSSGLIYSSRYEFKATFPRRYEGRPIIHYHYKVSWERAMKSKNFLLCL